MQYNRLHSPIARIGKGQPNRPATKILEELLKVAGMLAQLPPNGILVNLIATKAVPITKQAPSRRSLAQSLSQK